MAIFQESTPSQQADSSLRLPAQKRISTPASQRLSTITESANAAARAGQTPRSILRNSGSNPATPRRPGTPRQLSGGSAARPSHDTTRTGPPAYAYKWVPEVVDGDEDLTAPVEGEKLAGLRRAGGHQRRRKRDRGGWGRLALIAALIILLVIALAVGLGVGLARKKSNKNNSTSSSASNQPAGTTPDNGQAPQFPLGEYSLITALRTVNTNCTSNSATWRCYPDTIFSASDSGTNTSSLATFNWLIANTSSHYATNLTAATPTQGVPSNLTISSTNNPFSITFANEPLTYIASSTNTSSARYTFSFLMSKAVIPSTSITSNNAAAECFFNQTTFTGTLYLSANRTFPSASLADSTAVGGYTPWPYAVEISQASPGGENVPACYEMVNGGVGDRILTAVTPEPVGDECFCDYRNY